MGRARQRLDEVEALARNDAVGAKDGEGPQFETRGRDGGRHARDPVEPRRQRRRGLPRIILLQFRA